VNDDKIKSAVNILRRHNKWRRGDDTIEPTDPTTLGIALDAIIEYFDNISTVPDMPNTNDDYEDYYNHALSNGVFIHHNNELGYWAYSVVVSESDYWLNTFDDYGAAKKYCDDNNFLCTYVKNDKLD
jgi:hypothetical protein